MSREEMSPVEYFSAKWKQESCSAEENGLTTIS